MSEGSCSHFATQSAACKRLSVTLAVVLLLVGVLGRLPVASALWAAAPLLMLAFADAAYVAERRRAGSENGTSNQRNPGNKSEAAVAVIVRTILALFSLSVGPFYLGLFGIIVGAALSLPAPIPAVPATIANPSAQQPPLLQAGPQRLPNGPVGQPPITPAGPRPVTPVNFGARPFPRPMLTPPRSPGAAPIVPPPPR
jgi:hypothetical protein